MEVVVPTKKQVTPKEKEKKPEKQTERDQEKDNKKKRVFATLQNDEEEKKNKNEEKKHSTKKPKVMKSDDEDEEDDKLAAQIKKIVEKVAVKNLKSGKPAGKKGQSRFRKMMATQQEDDGNLTEAEVTENKTNLAYIKALKNFERIRDEKLKTQDGKLKRGDLSDVNKMWKIFRGPRHVLESSEAEALFSQFKDGTMELGDVIEELGSQINLTAHTMNSLNGVLATINPHFKLRFNYLRNSGSVMTEKSFKKAYTGLLESLEKCNSSIEQKDISPEMLSGFRKWDLEYNPNIESADTKQESSDNED